MRDARSAGRELALVVAVAVAVAVALALPGAAAAHPRGGGGRRVVHVGGYYGPWLSPWYGWGWGWGLYPPAYFEPEGGVSMGAAMVAGFGAVDLNVKPDRADVWVDGKYAGEARDFDGYPSYLWLAEGAHRLAVYKGGYLVFDEPVEVRRGMKTDFKIRLQPGDSPPPGTKPSGKPPAQSAVSAPVEKKQE
jgi:hypothetical protein